MPLALFFPTRLVRSNFTHNEREFKEALAKTVCPRMPRFGFQQEKKQFHQRYSL